MKHIKKFEDLDYTTYVNAADKMSAFGQKSRADKVRSHADKTQMDKINETLFDILVGESRVYSGAKFLSAQAMKEKNSIGILCVFTSGNNTHKVLATLENDGTLVWRDYNKFANRKSVNEYLKAVKILATTQQDIKRLLEEINIKPEELKVAARTFYL